MGRSWKSLLFLIVGNRNCGGERCRNSRGFPEVYDTRLVGNFCLWSVVDSGRISVLLYRSWENGVESHVIWTDPCCYEGRLCVKIARISPLEFGKEIKEIRKLFLSLLDSKCIWSKLPNTISLWLISSLCCRIDTTASSKQWAM